MTDIDSEDDDQSYDREFYQRLNQANSAAGAPAVMPEHHAAIAAQAEAINLDTGVELPYDRDPVARRIAGHMMGELWKVWDLTKRHTVWTQWCPEHDTGGTVASLYVVSYDDWGDTPGVMVALRSIEQLADVTGQLFIGDRTCHARITRHCKEDDASEHLAVKRGDYICVFHSCRECLHHIQSGLRFNDDYIGPDHDWVDDREPPIVETYDDPFKF